MQKRYEFLLRHDMDHERRKVSERRGGEPSTLLCFVPLGLAAWLSMSLCNCGDIRRWKGPFFVAWRLAPREGDTILQIEQWRATQQMNGRDASDRALSVTARIVGDCCGFSALPCHIDFSFTASSGTQLTGDEGGRFPGTLLKEHQGRVERVSDLPGVIPIKEGGSVVTLLTYPGRHHHHAESPTVSFFEFGFQLPVCEVEPSLSRGRQTAWYRCWSAGWRV